MLDDAKLEVDDDEQGRMKKERKLRMGGAGGTYPIVEVDDSVNYAAGVGWCVQIRQVGLVSRRGGRVTLGNFSRDPFLPPRQPASFPRKSSWLAGYQAQLTFHRPHDCK